MARPESKVNINTIAKAAKVSTTTVSNFINGTEVFPISAETRGRIREAMRKLNYRPHIGGVLIRRNASRRGKAGFVMGEDCMQPVLHTAGIPLVQRFLLELELALSRELDMSLEILRVGDEDSRADWNAQLLDIDCLINFGQVNALMCDTLSRRNLPMIEVSSTEVFRRHGDFSGVDDEFDFFFWRNDRQIESAFEHFYAGSRRRFLYMSSFNVQSQRPEYYGYDAQAKLDGFLRALGRHPKCSGTVLTPPMEGDFNMFREFALVREFLAATPGVLSGADAVICHNDIVAHGVASYALENGLRPGRDFLLSGEGHFRELQYWYPVITTSCVDYAALTGRICELIRLRAAGEAGEFRREEIPTLLVNP